MASLASLTDAQIRAKLAELEQLQAALAGKLARKSPEAHLQELADAQPKIVQGSKGHEALLTSGYGITKEEAQQIIDEHTKDPRQWPFAETQKARAYLAALNAKKLTPSDSTPHWVRSAVT